MLSCYSRWTLTREREKIGTKKETETVREEEEEEEEEEKVNEIAAGRTVSSLISAVILLACFDF